MDAPIELPDVFTSGELVLRPPTEGDVERITEICQDPDIQRFTRVPVPDRTEDAASFVTMANQALESGRHSGDEPRLQRGCEVPGLHPGGHATVSDAVVVRR